MIQKSDLTKPIIIRQEDPIDHEVVFKIIEEAFKHEEMSDHQEQFLVQRLRKSESFVPELSLVAEVDQEVVGYILLSKIKIKNGKKEYPSLALAPIAVHSQWQKLGIGSRLIKYAHQRARELGYNSVILLGHADYYPRFGFRKASTYGITLPFDVPDEYCVAIELVDHSLANISGIVEYPKEFY